MPIKLYMDQHVPRAITAGLRLRGIDVLTAYEDGTSELPDPALLDRASELERALFTRIEGRYPDSLTPPPTQNEADRETTLNSYNRFGNMPLSWPKRGFCKTRLYDVYPISL